MTEITTIEHTEMLSWNIGKGGFSDYDPMLCVPTREEKIATVIAQQHDRGVESAALIDAYRWDEVYDGNVGIAQHLGYADARFVRLEDDRLVKDHGTGVGIAFATDRRIESSSALDLGTRQGLGVILDVGKYGLQTAILYADHESEDRRNAQFHALFANLKTGIPTLILGDFNTLRPNMANASPRVKTLDLAMRGLALMLPGGIGHAIREMNRREVVPFIESRGFSDADAIRKRPTAPAILPGLGIDYVFHNNEVGIDNLDVLPVNGASDHRALRFRASVPAV